MKQIIVLTDYKGHFGSNWAAKPYRSGMDLSVISDAFRKAGYEPQIFTFSEIANVNISLKDVPVIYTSSEDIGYHYKDFIEDVVLYLQGMGTRLIPDFNHIRANNNKVFMELFLKPLRKALDIGPASQVFGVLEQAQKPDRSYPIVIKEPKGAMSSGVTKADTASEFDKKAKAISRSPYLRKDLKDSLRTYKHNDYKKESLYRNKFVTQEFIPDLQNDWKVLIFGDRYFIFSRPVRSGDFRASGSGFMSYKFGSQCEFPEGIFNFAKGIFDYLNVPQLSIDIAYDGNRFYLIEMQSLFFGTVGVIKSDVYFTQDGNSWKPQNKDLSLETIYTESILLYLNKCS